MTDEQLQTLITALRNETSAGGITPAEVADILDELLIKKDKAYKVFVGLITQTELYDPVCIVLENNLGDISFVRQGIGQYNIVSDGAFTLDRTCVFLGSSGDDAYAKFHSASCGQIDENVLRLVSMNPQDNNNFTDYFLQNTPIEIRVYQDIE